MILVGPRIFEEARFRGTSGCLASSHDRRLNTNATSNGPATGRLWLTLIVLPAGLLVTNISFFTGSTAFVAGASPHQWFALFDKNGNKLGVTGDDTSTAWGASTKKTLALAAAYTVTTTEAYYIGGCVVQGAGGTAPTLEASSNAVLTSGARNLAPKASGTADTGLSDPASCPTTFGAITTIGQQIYGEVS
jgi:hypothetical protein